MQTKATGINADVCKNMIFNTSIKLCCDDIYSDFVNTISLKLKQKLYVHINLLYKSHE